MQKTISYKVKTQLIEEILKQKDIIEIKKHSLLNQLTFKKKEFSDIYFHSGILDNDAINTINNTKVVIANSYTMKQDILKACDITNDKVEVIYPTVTSNYLKAKESKKVLCEEFNINKNDKIILFHSKNLKKNGAIEFLNIISSLNFSNFKAILAGDSKQIYSLKFQLNKYNLDNKLILIEDYPNIDLLYSAADIYILPTYVRAFNSNVIKAMFFKTAVFVSSNSASREVVDIFSTMDSPNDRSMTFKVEAILSNKDELKKIKKDNKETSHEFLFDIQLNRLDSIIANI